MPSPSSQRPVVVTGQQIGAGWTPALSVIKALAALVAARRMGCDAVFWMADEDHDHLEVAATVGLDGARLRRHRFRFAAPPGTATGWLPWGEAQQREAEALWGDLPQAAEPTLRGHFLALGEPLWRRGLRPFSPTEASVREGLQSELARWRSLDLERDLHAQAVRLEAQGTPSPLDPRQQHAWFSLDPRTGSRRPLEPGDPCPPGHWLSPGAALRPLLQSLLLNVKAAVLGPSERAYWRLCEPLWERVGLEAPELIARPTLHVAPRGAALALDQLDALQGGHWERFASEAHRPSESAQLPPQDPDWGEALNRRAAGEWTRYRRRLQRLDARLLRDRASLVLGMEAERLRQALFPFGKAQERVLPGLFWLRQPRLLDRFEAALGTGAPVALVEAP